MDSSEPCLTGTQVLYINGEAHIAGIDGRCHIIGLEENPFLINCSKCCISGMTNVIEKFSIKLFIELIAKSVLVLVSCVFIGVFAAISPIYCVPRNITTFFEIKSSWKYNHYCPTCDYKIATYIPRAGRMDKCILFLLYSFIVAMIFLLVIYA